MSSGSPERAAQRKGPFPSQKRGLLWEAASLAISSRYLVLSPLWMRSGSTATQMATPSFMFTARGWAPPMPPRPAVRTVLPARAPEKCFSARETKVSHVPWRIPWVPM